MKRLLLGTLALLAVLVVGVALQGVVAMKLSQRSLDTVFRDRVIVLKMLKSISDAYGVAMINAAQRVRAGKLSFEEGHAAIARARGQVDLVWAQYLDTYLVEDEKRLIAELEPLLKRANAQADRLSAALGSRDVAALETLLDNDTYRELEPVLKKVNELVDLQLTVTQAENEQVVRSYRTTSLIAGIGVLFGIGLVGFLASRSSQLVNDLGKSYEKLAKTQEELVARERLAVIGEMAAVVAHEVRNPLGSIFNCLSALRKAPAGEGDTALLLDILQEEADRLNQTVKALLDFTRPIRVNPGPTALDELLASSVDAALATQQLIEVHFDAKATLPKLSLDSGLLKQAFVNLVGNAIEEMPNGGRLDIGLELLEREKKKWVQVSIADTGPGIPAELQEQVFRPFFTTKATGTGLGLPVVRRIVEEHGGKIWVESAPGKGAMFLLRLPFNPAQDAPAHPA